MPKDENNSWWDRVGRPELVETLCKTKKGKIQRKEKIMENNC